MSRLGILSDDLTGGVEAAVACRRLGCRAILLLRAGSLPDCGSVLVVNTNTRHCAARDAGPLVGAAARALTAAGCDALFKKTDSTLRGPIAAELAALMDCRGDRPLVYAPAYPAAGRTVREGVLLVDGVPVDRTAFRNDPLWPVRTSDIAQLLRCTGRRVSVTTPGGLRSELESCVDVGRIVVVDGETESDLELTAASAVRNACLLAGSAALVPEFARLLALPREPRPDVPVQGPWLILAGSGHPVSLAQVRVGLAGGAAGLHVPPQAAFSPRPSDRWMADAARALDRAWSVGKPAVIYTALDVTELAGYSAQAEAMGLDRPHAARRLTEHLAECAVRLLEDHPGNVVVFGGETSQAFTMRVGATELEALVELAPGAGIMLVRGASRPMLLATKSGGFGDETFLEEFTQCCWE